MHKNRASAKQSSERGARDMVAALTHDLDRVFISEDSASRSRKAYYSSNNKFAHKNEKETIFVSYDKKRQYRYESAKMRNRNFKKGEKECRRPVAEKENEEIPEERELEKMRSLRCKKNYILMTKVRVGSTYRSINVVQGLELWDNFLDAQEQLNLIDKIEQWNRQGQEMELIGRTYSAPKKWMRGKGRKTIQFGCCYNYAVDKKGRQPGILIDEPVEQMPSILNGICERLVRWHLVPSDMKPDSAIINIYEEGDCIPPHIDNKQFCRPFVTISLLSNAFIAFGHKIKVKGPGEFMAPMQIMLQPGSCLVLKGNGADIAEHCIPAVKERRISITLRKMGIEYSHKIKEAMQNGRYGWKNVHESEVMN